MANSGPHAHFSPTQLFDFCDDISDDDGALKREATCSPPAWTGVPPPPLDQLPEYSGVDSHRDGDHEAATQVPSSLFSNERPEKNGEKLDTKPIEGCGGYDDDVSTASGSTDDERQCKIDLRHCKGIVTWKDTNQQDQRTSDLCIDLYVDTKQRQAIFALHGFFYFKTHGPKAHLSLLIYPERIQSIELEDINSPSTTTVNNVSGVSLRFSLTQPPSLMVPKDRPLEPKPRYQTVVDAIVSLGSVNRFTFHLSDVHLEVQQQLALLPSIFSPAYPFGPLRTDEKWRRPSALYEYTFSEVIGSDRPLCASGGDSNQKPEKLGDLAEDEDDLAPPYSLGDSQKTDRSIGPSSRKRRASEPLNYHPAKKHGDAGSRILGYETPTKESQPPSIKSETLGSPAQLSTPSDRKRQRTTELLSPVTNTDIISALRQVLNYNVSLTNRISQLETRLEHCSSRIESLVTELAAATAHRDRTPCRYDTEEAEHVYHQIDHRIDDGLDNVRHELEETVKLEAEERVAEEVKLQHEELREKLEAEWTEDLRQNVAEQIASEVQEKTTVEVVKGIAEVLMGAYQARQATQGGAISSTAFPAPPPPTNTLPGETALREAVQDIQTKFKDELSGQEMMGVLDILEESPLAAVKYNACGEETRRAYVMKWKSEVGGRGVVRRGWYR
ncbi:hypothetical protein B0T20DRAFT_432101 [Sordaria brevicollis]|uniref:Uncharacterized protein n=1 Tax=Sordaria brevicollis TaxID=83679 RepID=A0AAE0UFK9_SORBR|nr:hypothetical protein B0T20DRAFT_432101 [Sordaria brevicollis]